MKKLIPYVGFSFIPFLIALGQNMGFSESIGFIIFYVAFASITFFFASKKHNLVLAWLLSFSLTYWGIVFLRINWVILKRVMGIKSSTVINENSIDPNNSSPAFNKTGTILSAENNISRLESDIETYEKDLQKGLQSPSSADRDHASKILAPMIADLKGQLKREKDHLELSLKNEKILSEIRQKNS
jgi:hypothetical protein